MSSRGAPGDSPLSVAHGRLKLKKLKVHLPPEWKEKVPASCEVSLEGKSRDAALSVSGARDLPYCFRVVYTVAPVRLTSVPCESGLLSPRTTSRTVCVPGSRFRICHMG